VRSTVAVLWGIAVLGISAYFFVHLRRPAGPEPIKDVLTAQKIEIQEDARYLEFSGDLSRMEIHADRNYLGADGLYHLESDPNRRGQVMIVDRGKKGGRDLRFRADRIVYEKDFVKAVLSGRVAIESRGLTVAAASFDYDKAADIFRNTTGVKIESERFSGTARTMTYSLQGDTAVLEGEIDFKLKPQGDNPETLRIFAARMVFNYTLRLARFEGGVRLVHGRSRGRAETVEILLFPDRDDLQFLWLMGKVDVRLREPKPAPKSPPVPVSDFKPLFSLESETQNITADQLMLTARLDVPRINSIRARGRAAFILTKASGGRTRIEGEAVRFFFDRDGALDAMALPAGGRLLGSDPGDPVERRLEGSLILYESLHQGLKSFGSPAVQAFSKAAGREVRADRIGLFLRDNNGNASGNVRIVVDRKPKAAGSAGFFQAGKPFFIQAEFLAFTDKDGRLIFNKGVRMWQDKQVLEARELTFTESSEDLAASGEVRSSFVQAPKEGAAEERVVVGGDGMAYDPRIRRIVFSGNGVLRLRDIDLKADELTILPAAEPGRTETIQARRRVFIRQGLREATGEAADYEIAKETIVLTGRPVLFDKAKGTIRGDKLTFRLADGNILVENRDQERSEIVIKS
jgi:lipopolysaccharide export system protein LptA